MEDNSKTKKKIIIIGGGFAGAKCAKTLQKDFDVTLIDNKDYFEFTPSVLHVIVKPEHLMKIEAKHTDYFKGNFILGEAKEISEKEVLVEKMNQKEAKLQKLKFDYLIIASGSKYSSPIKDRDVVVSTRGRNLKEKHNELVNAKSVSIIGGGLVGVELATEINSIYPDKKVEIIERAPKIMLRFPENISSYAEKILEKYNVKIQTNANILEKKDKTLITEDGRKITSDLTFLCTGIKSNFESMEKNFSKFLSERKQIKVNEFLQVSNSKSTYKNIFAAGDITDIREEKTAQSAEKQAEIVIKNIKILEKNIPNKNLINYKSQERIIVISLGKNNGILTYKNFMLTGFIPAFLKKFVEWKTMIKYR